MNTTTAIPTITQRPEHLVQANRRTHCWVFQVNANAKPTGLYPTLVRQIVAARMGNSYRAVHMASDLESQVEAFNRCAELVAGCWAWRAA